MNELTKKETIDILNTYIAHSYFDKLLEGDIYNFIGTKNSNYSIAIEDINPIEYNYIKECFYKNFAEILTRLL